LAPGLAIAVIKKMGVTAGRLAAVPTRVWRKNLPLVEVAQTMRNKMLKWEESGFYNCQQVQEYELKISENIMKINDLQKLVPERSKTGG
jgi:hypothetical protein